MISISVCMIVKNEEKVLARCLDSLRPIADEIIIADTGSTDATKEIAARYTDKIYDFTWIHDFSAARNFAFSKATKDYIYSADADEVLSSENWQQFQKLKECLLPEIEIVQMKYGNQLQFGTVYNFDEEYRPKLFKRKRDFVWEEAIHEAVRLMPIVYDSDIVITHMPHESHAKRDLQNFRKQIEQGKRLSSRLQDMYTRELYLAGDEEDLVWAAEYLKQSVTDEERSVDEVKQACCVLAKLARIQKDAVTFMKFASKVLVQDGCSEICYEMGLLYEDEGDLEEAVIWYYNAAYETPCQMSLKSATTEPLIQLVSCYEKLGMPEVAEEYRRQLEEVSQ